MTILPSTITDLDTIFSLYDKAIAFQKAVSEQHWLPFERTLVEKEIDEKRQWKIMDGDKILCLRHRVQ